MNIKINKEIKDVLNLIPDNAILFGGMIRDTIANQKYFHDIDLLFSTQKEVNDFISSLSKNNIAYEARVAPNYIFNKRVTVVHVTVYLKEDNNQECRKSVTFDCVYPNNPEESFFTDYDVNSLFGYLSEDKESINIVNSFIKNHNSKSIKDGNVKEIIESIFNLIKNHIASSYMIEENSYRTGNLQSHGYITYSAEDDYRPKPTEADFFSAQSVFEQVKAHKQANTKVADSSDKSFSAETKKEKNMSNNKHLDFFTNNLVEGAYAGVASQVIERLGDSIILAIKKGGVDETSIVLIESSLKTPVGKALLSMLVGAGIHFIPADFIQKNNHLQKVADKCVQNAGSEGIQAAFNLAMTFVVPALMGAISDNPQLKALESLEGGKFRVPLPEDKSPVIEEDIPDLTKFAANKKANAS